MPRNCIKFISGFLIPSLNEERFGNRLKWINKDKSIFQIDWYHKGGPNWTEQEAGVFMEWDKHKGHYKPGDKLYFTKSKQRFRALLYKLTLKGQIKKLKSEDKFKKVYCIGEGVKRKRNTSSSSDSSSEYEFFNEDENTKEGFENKLHLDICKKIVSEENMSNILEDHAYCADRSSDRCLEVHADQVVTENNYSEVPTLVSLYESPDCPERKVIVQCKYSDLRSNDCWVTIDTNCLQVIPQNVPLNEDVTCANEVKMSYVQVLPFTKVSDPLQGDIQESQKNMEVNVQNENDIYALIGNLPTEDLNFSNMIFNNSSDFPFTESIGDPLDFLNKPN